MQPAIELADGFRCTGSCATSSSTSGRRPSSTSGRRRRTIRTAASPTSARCSVSRTSRGRCARSSEPKRRRSRARRIASRRFALDAMRSNKGDIARRIAAADHAAGGVFTLRRPGVVSRRDRKTNDRELPRLRRVQSGAVEPGPVLLQTLNILEGSTCASWVTTPRSTCIRSTKPSNSRMPIATRITAILRSGDRADCRLLSSRTPPSGAR